MKRLAYIIIFLMVLTIFSVSASDKIIIKADVSKEVAEDIKDNIFLLYFNLGKLYFANGDFEKASKLFEKSTEIKEDFKEGYYNLGVVYYYQSNLDEAVAEINKAIDIDEDYAKAHYSLGLIYYELKDYDNAILNLLKVIELEENANANFDLGVVYADRFRYADGDISDLEEAIKYYKRADEIQPGFLYALNNAEILKSIINEQ